MGNFNWIRTDQTHFIPFCLCFYVKKHFPLLPMVRTFCKKKNHHIVSLKFFSVLFCSSFPFICYFTLLVLTTHIYYLPDIFLPCFSIKKITQKHNIFILLRHSSVWGRLPGQIPFLIRLLLIFLNPFSSVSLLTTGIWMVHRLADHSFIFSAQDHWPNGRNLLCLSWGTEQWQLMVSYLALHSLCHSLRTLGPLTWHYNIKSGLMMPRMLMNETTQVTMHNRIKWLWDNEARERQGPRKGWKWC